MNWVVLFSLIAITGTVHGNETPAGKIDRVKGEVVIKQEEGHKTNGREGFPLFPGDRIETGKEGAVWFTLLQGQQFRLGEEAEVEIDELSGPEVEDGQKIIRLVLGYLWTKVLKRGEKEEGLEVHTPTAVLGVRGTEFDSVVSLDASTVVVVDEGKVELDSEGETVLVGTGEMSEAGVEIRPTAPVASVPKERRDWKAWREKRLQMLSIRLPRIVPRLLERLKVAVNKSKMFIPRVRDASDRLRATMNRARKAKKENNNEIFFRSMRRLKAQVDQFKKMASRFREGQNRVKVMVNNSRKIERHVSANRARFKAEDLDAIESDLKQMALYRIELKDIFRQAIIEIRTTFRELRAFRIEMGRSDHGPSLKKRGPN